MKKFHNITENRIHWLYNENFKFQGETLEFIGFIADFLGENPNCVDPGD